MGFESWGWRGVGGRGWGCVNNANATSLIIDCVFFFPLSNPSTPTQTTDTIRPLRQHPTPPPTFISLFSFVSLSFHPHYSRAPTSFLLPVVLKLNLRTVLSLLSLLLLGHLAGNVGIHGNPRSGTGSLVNTNIDKHPSIS